MNEKILIVDDRQNIRQSVCRCLEINGYRTAQAVNGRQAVEMANQGDVALILMDVVMPEMTGPAAAARIREDNADMPIIHMSSYNSELTGISVDRESFLAKPFEVEELLREIKNLLSPVGAAAY